jgi:hypothetical protein
MSADKLVLSGDYIVQTAPGGTITLKTDVTTGTGQVVITGNLVVQGVQTTIESVNATISDNKIVLNSGETGVDTVTAGSGSAGISIDRGNQDADNLASTLYWNESGSWPNHTYPLPNSNVTGIWQFQKKQQFTAIEVAAIKFTSNPLGLSANYILTDGYGPLNIYSGVNNASNYNDLLTSSGDPNDIPNVRYVQDYVTNHQSNLSYATSATYIQLGGEAVMINDNPNPGPFTTASNVVTYVNSMSSFEVYEDEIRIPAAGLVLTNSSIEGQISNADIQILTNGNGVLAVNNGISFQTVFTSSNWTPPLPQYGKTQVYSTTTVGAGSTGLLFNHSDGTNVIQGELISARKALLLGIIF